MSKFLTIRQTAATGILTEHRLRIMLAENRLPGIFTGNRFLVNVNALLELLENESKSHLKEGEFIEG